MGNRIAFVVRENPEDEEANQSSDALISNVYVIDVENGDTNPITSFDNAQVGTPFWSPDGNTLAFTVVVNGRMNVSIADVVGRVESSASGDSYRDPGEIKSFETESTCCPAWMRK